MEDLNDYENYPPSKSCYLDGRYFNLVLGKYPGLLPNPLEIKIKDATKIDEKIESIKAYMGINKFNKKYPGLLRLRIIFSNAGRKSLHSNLLIIDFKNNTIYRFEPLRNSIQLENEINRLIMDYFRINLNQNFKV